MARVCREGAVNGGVPLELQVINTKTMEELGYEVRDLELGSRELLRLL